MAKQIAKAPQTGDPAPDIELLTDTGELFRLSELRGKTVILYFYPRANTPGCTTEACEFRDLSRRLEAAGVVVVGVSPDSPSSQSKFKTKFALPFTLLCDTAHDAARAYGVWKEKNMYGRKVMGIERSTFVIGKDGVIQKVYAKVKAKGHAAQVLSDLSLL